MKPSLLTNETHQHSLLQAQKAARNEAAKARRAAKKEQRKKEKKIEKTKRAYMKAQKAVDAGEKRGRKTKMPENVGGLPEQNTVPHHWPERQLTETDIAYAKKILATESCVSYALYILVVTTRTHILFLLARTRDGHASLGCVTPWGDGTLPGG